MSSPSTVTEYWTCRWPAGVAPRAIAPPQRLTSTASARSAVRRIASTGRSRRSSNRFGGVPPIVAVAVGHHAERACGRLAEEERCERAPGVVGAAGIHAAQRDGVGREDDRDVQRVRHGVLAEAREQVRREAAVKPRDAAEHLANGMQPDLERDRHAEVRAGPAQRPEEPAAPVLARRQRLAVSGDDVARTRLSAPSPCRRDRKPWPPPKVKPATPTVGSVPETGARHNGAAASMTSPQVAPAPTRATRRSDRRRPSP
jgi:hypothetical protein